MKVSLALVALLVGALTVPVGAAPAAADPAVSGEFAVAGGIGTNAQITAGPDGNMWVTVQAGNDVARIAPDGTVTEFDSADMSFPVGIVAGPDGNLWVTQNGSVARFAPGDPTVATKFPIAELSDPRALTVGADGNLWTASNDKVIRIPPANPAGYTAFASTGLVGARWITSSSDGTLWVADFGGQQLVNVTLAGAGTPYSTPGGPQGVAGGEAGQVGYSNPTALTHNIGRVSPGGAPATLDVPDTDPFGVAYGVDKAYWIAEFAGNVLGRLAADGTYSVLGGFSASSGPRQLAFGPGNTLWVVLDTAEKVARVTGIQAPAPPAPPAPPPPPPTQPPAPTQPPVTGNPAPMAIAAIAKGSKLWVAVSAQCTKQFKFRVQKARAKATGVTWRNVGKTYRTKGKNHHRVVNRGKGTYRVVVRPACGYDRTTSNEVTLLR